ncbi:hypothetical protein AMK15_25040, partial [Streptomyces sp. MJM1172]
GVEAGLWEVRADDGSGGWAEGGVPDGRVGVPAPAAEVGVSDLRAEAAVPGGRAGVPAPGAEVRAEAGVSDGPATGAEVAGVSEASGAGAAVVVPHTRDGEETEARPGRGDVPAARADAPGPGVVDLPWPGGSGIRRRRTAGTAAGSGPAVGPGSRRCPYASRSGRSRRRG